MATTNLIVDFLVIGVTSFVWISPVLLIVQGNKWFSVFTANSIAIGLVLLGFAYILGISISRLADDLLNRWNDKWCDQVFGKNAKPNYHNQLNFIVAKSESATDYLAYRRSIIRITRACSINFLLGTLAWIPVAVIKSVPLPRGSEIAISALSAVIFFLLIRALPVVLKGYFSTIKDIHKYLSNSTGKK